MRTSKRILITGGSGMIGRRLTSLLMQRDYQVAHLGRSKKDPYVETFVWDPSINEIDRNAIRGVDAIIHLAGAGVADKRWSKRRKEEILLSRTTSTRVLSNLLKSEAHQVRTFISASGIAYYGLGEPRNTAFGEADSHGEDFMARVAVAWEDEVLRIGDPKIRKVIVRTGVALDLEGGALPKLVTPVKYFVGAPLGTGDQYFNWIHIDDLCRIYLKAIDDTHMEGIYNGVAPNPVTNKEVTRKIAHLLKKPLFLPAVPAIVVKLIAGEVADLVLKGGKVSSGKIEKAGFDFRFRTVDAALGDLLLQKV